MAGKIQAVRGMHDILPEQIGVWQHIESEMRGIFSAYGYREIRLPIVEKTNLFRRSIGEVTDIVEKEMYTFADRNGDSLTLRPEGTAGCLRACMEHGLLHNQIHRLWYIGAMFRHERPQKGRYRQFYQVGVETYGMRGPDIDAELIMLTARMWRLFGVNNKLQLQLNSLGSGTDRANYREKLVEYFSDHHSKLDDDSQRRLQTNPLRILDSKNPEMYDVIAAAPLLSDYLSEESQSHFSGLCRILDSLEIPYHLNPRLVRGLDYYCETVFEWVTDELGAQGTVCAGGRYDGLVEQLGGKTNTAVGFAMGMERLVELVAGSNQLANKYETDIYIVRLGNEAELAAMALAEKLRDALPKVRITVHCGEGGFKSQFKRADRCGAAFALILGNDEIANGVVGVKPLRVESEQLTVDQTSICNYMSDTLKIEMRNK